MKREMVVGTVLLLMLGALGVLGFLRAKSAGSRSKKGKVSTTKGAKAAMKGPATKAGMKPSAMRPAPRGARARPRTRVRPRPRPGPLKRPLRVVTQSYELIAPGLVANGGAQPKVTGRFAKERLNVHFRVAKTAKAVEEALALGGSDPGGADIAIVPLPTFVASYERLQALQPRIFMVIGRSRGREGLTGQGGASLLKPPVAGPVKLKGHLGDPATLLALFAFGQAGIATDRIQLVTAKAPFAAENLAQRTGRAKVLISTADAIGLIPYVAIASQGTVNGLRKALAAFGRGFLAGGATLAKNVPAGARVIAKQKGAPKLLALLRRLGWIRFTDLRANARLAGVSGRGAVSLHVLFRRTWQLWRAAGAIATAAPERTPLSTDIILDIARSGAKGRSALPKRPRARPRARRFRASRRTLFVRTFASDGFTPQEFVNELGWLAGVFSRSVLRVWLKQKPADAKKLLKRARERFNLAAKQVVPGRQPKIAKTRKAVAAIQVLEAK